MYYNTSISVEYKTTTEYRKKMYQVFDIKFTDTQQFDVSKIEDKIYVDDFFIDDDGILRRFEFDRVNEGLDYIYNETKQISLFQELYSLAAAKVFSTDQQIGLTMLFSYDYFPLFHACLCDFLLTQQITCENPHFVILNNILTNK